MEIGRLIGALGVAVFVTVGIDSHAADLASGYSGNDNFRSAASSTSTSSVIVDGGVSAQEGDCD